MCGPPREGSDAKFRFPAVHGRFAKRRGTIKEENFPRGERGDHFHLHGDFLAGREGRERHLVAARERVGETDERLLDDERLPHARDVFTREPACGGFIRGVICGGRDGGGAGFPRRGIGEPHARGITAAKFHRAVRG